jgi:hypothetical protein
MDEITPQLNASITAQKFNLPNYGVSSDKVDQLDGCSTCTTGNIETFVGYN